MRLEQFANLRRLRCTHRVAAGVDEPVGICPVFQQQLDHLPIATAGRGVQGRAALGVVGIGPCRLRASLQQQADDVETAQIGSGIERPTIVGTLFGDAGGVGIEHRPQRHEVVQCRGNRQIVGGAA